MLAVYRWDSTDSYFCSSTTVLFVGGKNIKPELLPLFFPSIQQLINTALFPCSSKALNANVIPVWFLLCPYRSITICPSLRLPEISEYKSNGSFDGKTQIFDRATDTNTKIQSGTQIPFPKGDTWSLPKIISSCKSLCNYILKPSCLK